AINAAARIVTSSTGNVSLTADRSITLNTGTSITTTDGAIVLNSDRNASSNGAIYLDNASIATTTGEIILSGGNGATLTDLKTTGFAWATDATLKNGVSVLNNSRITSTAGDITLRGRSAAFSGDIFNSNYGIQLANSEISSTTGIVNLAGIGGTANINNNDGIRLDGAALIETTNGAIVLTGQGGTASTAGGMHGIRVSDTSQIRSQGTGTLSLTGTGGSSTAFDNGITLISPSTLASAGGTMSLTGIAGTGADSIGLRLVSGITLTGGADLVANASSTVSDAVLANGSGFSITASDGSDVTIQGTSLVFSGGSIAATNGNVRLTADRVDVSAATLRGTGGLTIAPLTPNTTFTPTLGTIPSGFSSVTIGDSTTGTINFTGNTTLGSPTTIVGTTIDLASGAALNTGLNDLTLTASRNILLNSGSSITST
ncbi:MAG: beta strand repeat-containing protein, partial [Prochlorotrichaceae cyanobacterium]